MTSNMLVASRHAANNGTVARLQDSVIYLLKLNKQTNKKHLNEKTVLESS